ncbi:hypothetical protein B296_00026145 [Ensete ventricosum]|uniref:Uncharacterized protein n=1 Tax=Ensete ventricosum TaxID=4639 RepID=A0A427APF3_ENSVE|nr:hypothetical protein B296_00026145 [Ensete ventricosum]
MTQLKVAEGEDPLMSRWSAIAGCSQFWTERSTNGEYLCGALHPTLAQHIQMLLRGAYEQDQQVDRLGKRPFFHSLRFLSQLLFELSLFFSSQGLHCIIALIDRVHDAGRLVRSQHERILALRAANKELKGRADQDLVAIVESTSEGVSSLPSSIECKSLAGLGPYEDQVSRTNGSGLNPSIVESGDHPLVM